MAKLTVLDWLKSVSSGYVISENALIAIAQDRGVNDPTYKLYEALTNKEKDLMQADIIFQAVVFSPSGTASHTVQHNNFTEIIGSQSDTTQKMKLQWAMSIYKTYDDGKYYSLSGSQAKVKVIQVLDKI